MSGRILIIERQGAEVNRVALEGERLIIGRDPKAQLRLDDKGISRQHAAVIHRFGVVYIENISATGQVLKNDEPVEFCELGPGERITIGPFALRWEADGSAPVFSPPSPPEEDTEMAGPTLAAPLEIQAVGESVEEMAPAEEAPPLEAPPAEASFEEGNFDPGLELNVADEAAPPTESPSVLAGLGNANEEEIAPPPSTPELSLGGMDLGLLGGNNTLGAGRASAAAPENAAPSENLSLSALMPVPVEASQASSASASGETKVAASSEIVGVLKIVKGEKIGREIRLSDGATWTVGRSGKANIRIDNSKLSRTHFKIHKIGNAFRIEDLGSANGTRLNGVTVSESGLNSFDTIQAGPVELQFLVTDLRKQGLAAAASPQLSAPEAAAGLALTPGGTLPGLASTDGAGALNASGAGNKENTVFAPPVPYNLARSGNTQVPPQFDPSFLRRLENVASGSSAKGGGTKIKLKHESFWSRQPTGRKILYTLLFLVLLAAGLANYLPEPPITSQPALPEVAQTAPEQRAPAAAAAPTPAPAAPPANAAEVGQVSSDFDRLTPEKQNQVKDAYAKAERARAEKDWQHAFENARAVLDMVKRYKDATDILDEAQTYLNESEIGLISKQVNNVADAARENSEKIDLYNENGEKALKEGRWEDAQESFSKALNLDPTNARASRGFAAASAKDPKVKVDAPNQPAAPMEVSAEEKAEKEARAREREEMLEYQRQFREANNRIHNGNHREALEPLKDLDEKLNRKLEDFAIEGGPTGRMPASVRENYASQVRRLHGRVREALEAVRAELHSQYQTQFADADEMVTNRQYVQAREIYDRILRREPAFEEARENRRRLYAKILTEARNTFQEALIYESVGDLDLAVENFQKSKELLTNVEDPTATDYYRRSVQKLARLRK